MNDWNGLVQAATAIVRRRAGLTQAGGRDVSMAMKRVMTAAQRAHPEDYLRLLDRDAGAFDALIGELTVGETFFLRESEQLDFLRREVIPVLAGRRFGTIQAWSAGCASGEEAYTLSMLFHEAGLSERTRILGTDIAPDRVRRARRGRYRPWSFRGVPEPVQRRYFRPTRGGFEVVPELRGPVDFHCLNLLDDDYRQVGVMPGGMDLILCRNVLIYLDAEYVAEVARRLFDSLRADGWLLLAAADPRLHDLVSCEAVVTGSGVIYRKAGRPLPRSATATPAASSAATAVPTSEASIASETQEARPTATPAEDDPSDTPAAVPVEAVIARVRQLADRGELREAAVACAAALERQPHSAELAYLESVLLFEAGNHSAAAAAARRALYLDPGLAVAHLALGNAFARLGRTEAAHRSLLTAERLLSELPPDSEVAASGGASAAALTELARIQLRLLQERTS